MFLFLKNKSKVFGLRGNTVLSSMEATDLQLVVSLEGSWPNLGCAVVVTLTLAFKDLVQKRGI